MLKKSDLIIPLSSISNDDKDLVGEQAASLGEMIKHGFPLPDGFVITQNAFHQFALKHKLPNNLVKEIFRAYKHLDHSLKDATVELISSSNGKEIIIAKGEAVLLEKVKYIWSHNATPIVVRKIIQTAKSGVMFTINPSHNDITKIVIYEDDSDNHYEVLKRNFKITFKAIKRGTRQKLTHKQIIDIAALGKKLQRYCYFPQEVHFAIERNKIFITQTKPITTLNTVIPAKAGIQELTRFPIPTSQSFAGRGKSGMTKMRNMSSLFAKKSKRRILLRGKMLHPGIATGHLRIIQNMQDVNKILRGEVIVIPYQDLIKHPIIKAGAIVATDNRLHNVQHLTIGPYFSGKPAIITTPDSVRSLTNGAVVTVNGKNGEVFMGSQWQ